MSTPETQATPAAPDLSGLSRETQINVLVAVTQGWQRQHCSGNGGWVWMDGRKIGLVLSEEGVVLANHLPDYLHDSSASGPLMERERIGVVPWSGGWAAFFVAYEDVGTSAGEWYRAPLLGEAVCLADLAKHGVEVPG